MYYDENNSDTFEAIPAEHGTWKCYGFKTNFNGRQTAIIGLPHLSYYNPNKEKILEWIRNFSGL